MRLRYEEDFVEAAVCLRLKSRRSPLPALQLTRFHHEREKLYRVLDPDERNAAFFKLHLDWFREWGLEKLLTGPLREFPMLDALTLFAFRKPRGKQDEGGEMYVNEAGERHGVMALRPERMEVEPDVTAFLRHELMHLHDMVDPAFQYRPALALNGLSPSQLRLAHERYRLLWDVTIDGRLAGRGQAGICAEAQRRREFDTGFTFWPEERREQVFQSLWRGRSPSHAVLTEYVRDPRDLESSAGPCPGAPCPLCRFPTFDWVDTAQVSPQTSVAIHAEFPHWTLSQGACGRCADIYRIVAAREAI